MAKKIIIILAVVLLLYLVISFWERDEVISLNVDDSGLYVVHKRSKGYSIFSLNIHAGRSSVALESDVYVSSWTPSQNSSGIFYELVSDWEKILSTSGGWVPPVYKVANEHSYVAYHNISHSKQYLTRYTFAADNLTTESKNLMCVSNAAAICFAMDRYAKYYISSGLIYNTTDFGVFKSLSGKEGYERFKNIIKGAQDTFAFIRIYLSSDTKYLFGLSDCKKSQKIFAYDIEEDTIEEITLENYETGCMGSMEIRDIDSHDGAIYLVIDPDSESHSTRKPHKYIIYDFSNSAEYSVEIKDYYYGISEDFWDVRNHTIYAIDGDSADDVDKISTYEYISGNYKRADLDQLIHWKEME